MSVKSPLRFKNGKVTPNRVVVPPMASQTADDLGFVTEKTLNHYSRLTTSLAGIVMAEYSYVHPSGRSEENQLGVWGDAHIQGLTDLAATIHRSGALAAIQLTHAGGKTSRNLTGGALMAPSPIAVPVKGTELEIPAEMTITEVESLKSEFRDAADRAVKAGFDIVELHAAHGYGLNQWLSPLTNHRSDGYGGSTDNRARILYEITQQLRDRYPELLLSVRFPGQDFIEGGSSCQDMIEVAKTLERIGVDILNVTSGIGGYRRPRERRQEGYLVPEAALVQANVTIPVVGVGGILTCDFIDRGLRQRWFSLAAVGRAIAEDPQKWAANVTKNTTCWKSDCSAPQPHRY